MSTTERIVVGVAVVFAALLIAATISLLLRAWFFSGSQRLDNISRWALIVVLWGFVAFCAVLVAVDVDSSGGRVSLSSD